DMPGVLSPSVTGRLLQTATMKKKPKPGFF
ncbi:uncharacterized protein METZ01_LOCUS369632, partial [marine metagenome]